jgi:N utilization substance protein A
VRLASQLTGWDIDILTEQEESERRQKEFAERSQLFINALELDEVVGQLLASEGFTSVEEIAYVEQNEIARIEGFDEETAVELQNRARDYLARAEAAQDEERRALGVEDALREVPGITTAMLVALGKGGVKTVEDFADLATDELIGSVERKDGETVRTPGILDGFELSKADAEGMILAARVQAGWISEADVAAMNAATTEAAEPAEADAAPRA